MGSSDTLRVWYEETDVDRVLRHLGHNGGETNIKCSRLASRRALAEITRLRKEVKELRDRADKMEAAALGEAELGKVAARERDQLAAQVAMAHEALKLFRDTYESPTKLLNAVEQIQSALTNTAATAEAHDERVRAEATDKILRLVNDRIDGLLKDEATQEPDTGEVNMPEWVETAIEELEGIATAIRSQDTG